MGDVDLGGLEDISPGLFDFLLQDWEHPYGSILSADPMFNECIIEKPRDASLSLQIEQPFPDLSADAIIDNLFNNVTALEQQQQTAIINVDNEHSYCQPLYKDNISLPNSSPRIADEQFFFGDGQFSDTSSYHSPSHKRTSSDTSSEDVTVDILEQAITLEDVDLTQYGNWPIKPNSASPGLSVPSLHEDDYQEAEEEDSSRDIEEIPKYGPVILTDEEQQLCDKEGVVFPANYPLTKAEERELKRIRRKIRNKRSAQNSRRKKAQYMEALEHRVKLSDREKEDLRRQVTQLTKQNESLLSQLKKLQAMVSSGGRRRAQTGTCLAVLLLSLALLVAPSYNPLSKKAPDNNTVQQQQLLTEQQIEALLAVKRAPFPGQTRTMLQASGVVPPEALQDGDAFEELKVSPRFAPAVAAAPRLLGQEALFELHDAVNSSRKRAYASIVSGPVPPEGGIGDKIEGDWPPVEKFLKVESIPEQTVIEVDATNILGDGIKVGDHEGVNIISKKRTGRSVTVREL